MIKLRRTEVGDGQLSQLARKCREMPEKGGELVLTYAIIFMLDCYSDSLYVMCLEVA